MVGVYFGKILLVPVGSSPPPPPLALLDDDDDDDDAEDDDDDDDAPSGLLGTKMETSKSFL